jgi:tRNA threonylcarbamoyl adenosine modification protein YeaZ
MKNIIAVSACLKRCSAAVSYENQLYEINENTDAAANLVWLVDNLVKSKNIDLKQISGIMTASGPGSFTGIRVAQSFAKGLALSLKLPSVSISYFDVVRSIYSGNNSDRLAVVIKSEKSQIYYQTNREFGISPPESVGDKIDGEVALAGDAIDEVVPHLKNRVLDAVFIDNFREAKHLLNFAHCITKKSQIHPLYITHSAPLKAN